MATFHTELIPLWDNGGTQPTAKKLNQGWLPTEYPPAAYWNWQWNRSSLAFKDLMNNAQHKLEKGKPNGYPAMDAQGRILNVNGVPLSKSDFGLDKVDNTSTNARGVLIEDFGAVGDGVTDDTSAFNALQSAYGDNPVTVYLEKTYYINHDIHLPSNYHLIGSAGAKIILSDPNGNPNDGSTWLQFNADDIQNVQIVSKYHTYQADYPQSNIKVKDNNYHANSYGVLLNSKANGENALIFGNHLEALYDPIELNTTTGNFFGTRIIGNHIDALANPAETQHAGGFAIGVAAGKDVVAVGNNIKHSRNEAIHIEDDQERVVITGNTINDCDADGAWIYASNTAGQTRPINFTNNWIKQTNNSKTGRGIWMIYDYRGANSGTVLTGNCIEGFNVGIDVGAAMVDVDGCTIKDCNVALSGGPCYGTVYAINCPTLVQGVDHAEFGIIISDSQPTRISQWTGSRTGLTLHGFSYPLPYFQSVNNGYSGINIFKLPTYFRGDITLSWNGADPSTRCHVVFSDAEYRLWGTSAYFTQGSVFEQDNGGIGGATLAVTNDGYLYFSVYTAGGFNMQYNLDFRGTWYDNTSY